MVSVAKLTPFVSPSQATARNARRSTMTYLSPEEILAVFKGCPGPLDPRLGDGARGLPARAAGIRSVRSEAIGCKSEGSNRARGTLERLHAHHSATGAAPWSAATR